MPSIDHLIVKVNEIAPSQAFFLDIMGFADAGEDGPFSVIRVSESFQLQLAPWGTQGGEHYAFAVSQSEFADIFERVKRAGIDFGPSFHNVGENTGPGEEAGAKGLAPTLYFFDPNQHLIEIRTYQES